MGVWISVNENLPEYNLPVLVAVKTKDRLPSWVKEQTYHYVTDIDVFNDDGYGWYLYGDDVVAWMYLPEPYKGDEQIQMEVNQ